MVNLTIVSFNSPIWPALKRAGFCRIIMDYHKVNQAVILGAATISDVILILEQTDILTSMWHVSIDVTNAILTCISYLLIGNCVLLLNREHKYMFTLLP